jgi:alpha-beta hydrolase superfamily lysophospholipase
MTKEKKFDINVKGYSIRCRLMTASNAHTFDRVVIVTHGFGGNKDLANITHFAEKETAKYKEDAVIAFDWPCHGQDARKKLDIDECLFYLASVVDYAKTELGAKDLYIYSVSFGAYLTLRYIADFGDPFTRIALRSPGIRMYEYMKRNLTPDDERQLERGKEASVGFERKMKVDQKTFDDLKAGDVTQHEYFDDADRMIIIHGTADDTVPIDHAASFAEDNVIEFIPVEGAEHTFRNPKHMDEAVHTIIEFFAPQA